MWPALRPFYFFNQPTNVCPLAGAGGRSPAASMLNRRSAVTSAVVASCLATSCLATKIKGDVNVRCIGRRQREISRALPQVSLPLPARDVGHGLPEGCGDGGLLLFGGAFALPLAAAQPAIHRLGDEP
jgi:hypothetical protein